MDVSRSGSRLKIVQSIGLSDTEAEAEQRHSTLYGKCELSGKSEARGRV